MQSPAIDTVFTMCAGCTRRDHARHEGADAVEDAPEVDAERPREVGRRPLPHEAAGEHARVVAQHVDRAERRERVVGERGDRVVVAHVGDQGLRRLGCGSR